MTHALGARLEEVLKSRDEKVQRLYGEHANNVLKTAEDFFINYPAREYVYVKVPCTNRIFFAYLREVATSEKWNFLVHGHDALTLMVTRRVLIYKKGASRCSIAEINKEYRYVLSEKVK